MRLSLASDELTPEPGPFDRYTLGCQAGGEVLQLCMKTDADSIGQITFKQWHAYKGRTKMD